MGRKIIKTNQNRASISPEKAMQALPIPAILSSIEMQINVLQAKGIQIMDWDNKSRTLKQVRMLGGKVYFFAEDKK